MPSLPEPRFSLIIRTAGARPSLLAQALESAQKQDTEGLEILVAMDGGSAPPPAPQVAGCIVRYLPFAKQGRSATANAGLAGAQGRYVGFLDDDDILLPGHLRQLGDALDRTPEAPAAFAGWYTIGRDTQFATLPQTPAAGWRHHPSPAFSRPALVLANLFPIQSVLFRREAGLQVPGFDSRLDALEDWDFWLQLGRLGPFTPVAAATSVCRVERDGTAQHDRERAHAAARDYLRAKHHDATFGFTGGEIETLHADLAGRLEAVFPTRALSAALLRALRRRFGL